MGQISIQIAKNGYVVTKWDSGESDVYIADTHRDVLDIIDNLLRPNGPVDDLPGDAGEAQA